MSTNGISSWNLPEVTPDEERQIREEYDEIIVTSKRPHQGKRLHIGTPDGKLCDHHLNGEPRRRSFAVFPQGHRPICRVCAELWRRSNGD